MKSKATRILNASCTCLREMASDEVVKRVECACCGIWEECTTGYIGWVQERFGGVWVCGLCEEAIKDEQARLGVGVEVALRVHATFRDLAAHADPAASIVELIKKIMSSSLSPNNKASLP